MTGIHETNASQANTLCRACGLCCTGHLFIWTKLRPAELDPVEALGMPVLRSEPRQRGFNQPCPLWHGECTVYASPHYPHACRAYKCKLLKEMPGESVSLAEALAIVNMAKEMIQEVEALLPTSSMPNFRERLVAHLERLKTSSGNEKMDLEFRQKARALLGFYDQVFGVTDVVDMPDEDRIQKNIP
jgi:hypothetical protein